MTRKSLALIIGLAVAALATTGWTQNTGSFDELSTLRDSAIIKEAAVFAPELWDKAEKKFAEARQAIQLKKKQKSIEQYVAQALEYTENAVRATEVAKNTLGEYLAPRNLAREAQAQILVPELYLAAENQFKNGTAKVESGDVKGGLKEADKAIALFDQAEVEAIRVEILGQADQLIAKAVTDDAEKFGLSTLDKARSARAKANGMITADRYNREASSTEAARAEYEAKHASNISQSVRALNRNDQAWEKLMLGYEIQMDRVGTAIGLEHLPFDNGPLAAADTLINYIKSLKSEKQAVSSQMGSLSEEVTAQLAQSLKRVGGEAAGNDPVAMAADLDSRLISLLAEKQELSDKLEARRAELATLSAEHREIAGELSVRQERDEKFRKAKQMLNPSEGEVLFNSSNDIVLRLSGLSFSVGKSDIKDEHMPLLEKVKEVIRMFPEAQLMVEGHTDASGDAAANMDLSERRAYAVLQYLRQSLLIPASKIQAMGFGADRPVASNRTDDGRAKNRRIDIIIMR